MQISNAVKCPLFFLRTLVDRCIHKCTLRLKRRAECKVHSLVYSLFRFWPQLLATAAARTTLIPSASPSGFRSRNHNIVPILTSDPKHTAPVARFCLFTSRFTEEVTTYKDRGRKSVGAGGSPPPQPHPQLLLLRGIIGWTPAECADGIGIDPTRS